MKAYENRNETPSHDEDLNRKGEIDPQTGEAIPEAYQDTKEKTQKKTGCILLLSFSVPIRKSKEVLESIDELSIPDNNKDDLKQQFFNGQETLKTSNGTVDISLDTNKEDA